MSSPSPNRILQIALMANKHPTLFNLKGAGRQWLDQLHQEKQDFDHCLNFKVLMFGY